MSIVVPNFTQTGGFLYFGSHFGFKPKWSQYGATCLTPCKYPSAVAMETKKGGFKKNLDSCHQTS
jgi:hypothetical protein